MSIVSLAGDFGRNIKTFATTGSTPAKIAKVALPITAGGAAIALSACGGRDPRSSASYGAELIGKYDRNGDGDITIDTESFRTESDSSSHCVWSHDANDDGFVGYDECESWERQTRSWNNEYNIDSLIHYGNRDGDNTFSSAELNTVLAEYDKYTGEGDNRVPGSDGVLDDGEQKAFERDWGEDGPRRIDD
jgi:hypothetical protein